MRALEDRQNKAYFDEDASLNGLHSMLEVCQNEGTIPFSILARHGFIAKSLLNSLMSLEVLDESDVAAIHSEIKTVAGELVDSMKLFQAGTLSRADFMNRFGHLRPGSYNILSPRYDQMADLLVEGLGVNPSEKNIKYQLSEQKLAKIGQLLKTEGFVDFGASDLLDYIANAIAGREYGKFVFTRTLSDILELLAGYGEQHGLSRDEISHVPIKYFLECATFSIEGGVEKYLREIAMREAERHMVSVAIRLPQVLSDEAGVYVIPFQVTMPNFVTHKAITAEFVMLNTHDDKPRLDPGFDWIFSKGIAGLITKYGGANSHMAIRCAEFGIPAAIGCGEQRFESLLCSSQVAIDCSAGTIIPFH